MRIISLEQKVTERHNYGLEKTLTAVITDGDDRKVINVTHDHPSWDEVSAATQKYSSGEMTNEELAELIVRSSTAMKDRVADKLVRVRGVLDNRMAIVGNRVTVDHEPIDGVLEAHILRLLKEDGTPKDAQNWRAFAKFVENLYANTSDFVREQLFGWINYENMHGQGFTITEDGCFIGYKGCAGTEEDPVSINHGTAWVDGVKRSGAIPNPVGAVVEMPRSEVEANPAVGCSYGLHVGTYDYAKGWARGVLLRVKVNPRDVVSVPTECDAQKIRTCRYEILEVNNVAYGGTTYYGASTSHTSGATGDAPYWDEDASVDMDAVEVGDTIVIHYRKASGRTGIYELEVAEDNTHYLEGELTNGEGYRSFLKRNILSATWPEGYSDDGEDEDDYENEEEASAPAFDFSVGDHVVLTYDRAGEGDKTYVFTVAEVGDNYVAGELDEGGYRRFGFERILEAGPAEEAPAAEEEANAEPQEERPTVEAAVKTFLKGALGHIAEETWKAWTADIPAYGDQDDPGTEEERERYRDDY